MYSIEDQSDLMEEAPDQVLKREEKLKIYQSTKEALKIISDLGKEASFIVPSLVANQNNFKFINNNTNNINKYGSTNSLNILSSSNNYNYNNNNSGAASYLNELMGLDLSRSASVRPPVIPKRPATSLNFNNQL